MALWSLRHIKPMPTLGSFHAWHHPSGMLLPWCSTHCNADSNSLFLFHLTHHLSQAFLDHLISRSHTFSDSLLISSKALTAILSYLIWWSVCSVSASPRGTAAVWGKDAFWSHSVSVASSAQGSTSYSSQLSVCWMHEWTGKRARNSETKIPLRTNPVTWRMTPPSRSDCWLLSCNQSSTVTIGGSVITKRTQSGAKSPEFEFQLCYLLEWDPAWSPWLS